MSVNVFLNLFFKFIQMKMGFMAHFTIYFGIMLSISNLHFIS